jgi:serine O-acetyltransferase
MVTRQLAEISHSATGIDIHPATRVGHSVFIDHGTGLVVGGTARIGNRVSLYQGVTLGAKAFKLDSRGGRIKGLARHPIVGDDVTVYANAAVLGRITVGNGATIGGNVWVTKHVRPGEFVFQKAAVRSPTWFSDGAGI